MVSFALVRTPESVHTALTREDSEKAGRNWRLLGCVPSGANLMATGTKQHAQREIRWIKENLRRMRSIKKNAHALNSTDSNCGRASYMTEAIESLIDIAIKEHLTELSEWKKVRKTGVIS